MPAVNKCCWCSLKNGIHFIIVILCVVSFFFGIGACYLEELLYLPHINSINFLYWFYVVMASYFVTTYALDASISGFIHGEQMDQLLKIWIAMLLGCLVNHLVFCVLFAMQQPRQTDAYAHFAVFGAMGVFSIVSILYVNSYRLMKLPANWSTCSL